MEDRELTHRSIPDGVVTRAYHVCELVRDVGSGVVPPERVLSGEAEADARAFIDAVDDLDGPGSERPGVPGEAAVQRRCGESRRAHVERLVQHFAGPAFWRQVAAAFPHITTGDFPPDATHAIESAMERAIESWVGWNEPQPSAEQMSAAGTLLQRAAMGENGITQTAFVALAAYTPPMSPGQAGDVSPHDLVVTIGAQDDMEAEEPGTERTFVTIIGREGQVKTSYEVQ